MSPDEYYTIRLPKAKSARGPKMFRVYPNSPAAERESVERFARYFLREMRTGGIQFEAAETPLSPGFVPYEAYLFRHDDRLAGACCFRRRERTSSRTGYELDWVWIHPYCRNRGLLTEAYVLFRVTYGDFSMARPLSPAMQSFVRKHGIEA